MDDLPQTLKAILIQGPKMIHAFEEVRIIYDEFRVAHVPAFAVKEGIIYRLLRVADDKNTIIYKRD